MYFVTYSTNKLELTLSGWNVWRVKSNERKGQASYRILDVLVGGKRRPEAQNVSIADSHYIAKDKREVVELIFEIGKGL